MESVSERCDWFFHSFCLMRSYNTTTNLCILLLHIPGSHIVKQLTNQIKFFSYSQARRLH